MRFESYMYLTEDINVACVANVSVQFESKELQGDGKIPKIPFLGLSLLPDLTETLAMEASINAECRPAGVSYSF